MRRALLPNLLLGLVFVSGTAAHAGEIVRCKGAGGSVTYQQIPCGSDTSEQRVGVASEYPPPNQAERDRLLAREAALDRRLEAERDRWQQDAALRAAREERELERARIASLEAQAQQQYAIAYPYWRPHAAHRPHRAATRSAPDRPFIPFVR
jgi:hypothetical protein